MEFTEFIIKSKGVFTRVFDIKTSNGKLYHAKSGSMFRDGLDLYDENRNVVLVIKSNSILTHGNYSILEDGIEVGIVNKDMLANNYTVKTAERVLTMKGNIFGSVFTIYDGDEEILKLSKQRGLFSKNYSFALKEGYDEELMICVVLVPILVARKSKG